jgi:protein-disulfide isomerase
VPVLREFARETAPALKAEFVATGKVRWIVRHFPLTSIHPHAAKAAEAVECAGAQGKWWDMHASLYADQQRLEESSLVARAEILRLDIAKFTRCLGGEMAEKLASDVQAGRAAGVSGTPTFFIGVVEGGEHVRVVRRLSGARPLEEFRSAIDAVLKQAAAEVR